MSITLLVGAPGSLLSETARRIGLSMNQQPLDVEEDLLERLSDQDRKVVTSRVGRSHEVDMDAVVRSFPREKVLSLWQDALKVGLSRLDIGSHALVVCHLTLFRSDRSEFYSTSAQLTRALVEHGDRVGEVVQLIDDIYDMYARLSVSATALSAEVRFKRWLSFSQKSAPETLVPLLAPDGAEAEHVEIETRAQTLSLLLNWRHQESMSAESLAHAIGARFTAFGAKHAFSSLIDLATSPSHEERRVVYVSHPISAYRRSISRAIGSGEVNPQWNDGVVECNSIPSLLEAGKSLVAIMPTAIDELRFSAPDMSAARLTERSPTLGPRWPLMHDGVGLVSHGADRMTLSDEEVQHRDVLISDSSTLRDQQFIGELTRLFEATVYNEIPYRDHLIVANCDGFLVHRPLSDKARLSSGVEHEVRHWNDRRRSGIDHLRLAVVHAAEDVRALRARWLGEASLLASRDEADRARESAKLRTQAREGIDAYALEFLSSAFDLEPGQAQQVLRGEPLSVEQLGGRTDFATEDSARAGQADAVLHGFGGFLYERLSLLRGLPRTGVRIFATPRALELTEDNTDVLRDFLSASDADSAAIGTIGRSSDLRELDDVLINEVVLSEFLDIDVLATDIALAHELGHAASKGQRLARHRAVAREAALTMYATLSASG